MMQDVVEEVMDIGKALEACFSHIKRSTISMAASLAKDGICSHRLSIIHHKILTPLA